MTFELQRFVRQTEALNSGAVTVDDGIINGPALYTYESSTDNLAAIAAAGYFDSVWASLFEGDFFIITGTDGSNLYIVDAIDPVTHQVTLVSFSTSGTVGTGNIQDGAVTLPKLAAGLQPAAVVAYADQVTTVGGAAAEAITITGVSATDRAFVQLVDGGTNTVSVVKAVCTANTLTVTFSADPGADAIVNYQILPVLS